MKSLKAILIHSLAIFGLGGYTFKGIYRELQKHLGATTHSYIIASRLTQGHQDWDKSSLSERQSIIDNYLKIKDDPAMKRTPNCPVEGIKHGFTHHNDSSSSSLESKASSPKSEHKHHEHAHSIRKHFSHHSDHSATDLVSDKPAADGEPKLGHTHSIRAHFHKHDSKVSLKEQSSHSTTELHNDEDGILTVHEGEVRKTMTID